MSSSNCCFLTFIQISQEAGQVVWNSHLFQNLPQFIVIHTVKGFGIVNKAEIDIFLELSCFFDDPVDIWLKLKKVGKTTRSFRYDLNKIPYDYTLEVRNRFKGLDLIEFLRNYGRRSVTFYRRQGLRPSPWKRNSGNRPYRNFNQASFFPPLSIQSLILGNSLWLQEESLFSLDTFITIKYSGLYAQILVCSMM